MPKKKKINFDKKIQKMYKSNYFKLVSGISSVFLLIIFGFPSLIGFFETREPIDISGEWKVIFEINESSYDPYVGNESGYKIYFSQKDREIKADGESWEFESNLNYDVHRPITFSGKIDKYTIDSNYTLYGLERTSYGKIEVTVDHNGKYMEGTFSGTGADVKGIVKAYKL
jgi:hypothetical protein